MRTPVGELIIKYARNFPVHDLEEPGHGSRRLSHKEMAARTGVARPTLSRWTSPNPDLRVDFRLVVHLLAVCSGLRIPWDEMAQAILEGFKPE